MGEDNMQDKRVALVTGANQGIGLQIAKDLVAHGFTVLVGSRNLERGEAAVKTIDGDARALQLDVTDKVSIGAAAERIRKELGRLDVLVNNAGILCAGNALDTTDEQWRDIMAVNVDALFFASRAAVKVMIGQGKGAIVNIASEWGLNGETGYVAYCTSKAAVVQMTRCMALDHAQQNIRVNAICPGEVHTQMVEDLLIKAFGDLDKGLKTLSGGIPMRRVASPIEIARCVRFLASDEASYVTGTTLAVDGGNDATAGPYP
jgi:meso-butanediol dehydrogenase / (S,S)-butanediol dehydrogenase / diacetyl reductase